MTNREIAEIIIQGMPWDNLSTKDWSGLSDAITKALDAARRDALEEAAGLCLRHQSISHALANCPEVIAREIRALKEASR